MARVVEKLWERSWKSMWGKLWSEGGKNCGILEELSCDCEKVEVCTSFYQGLTQEFAQKICSILPLLSSVFYTVSTEPITTITKLFNRKEGI